MYEFTYFIFSLFFYIYLVVTEKSSQTSSQSNDINNKADCGSADNTQLVDANSCNLKIGSVIKYGMPIQYGVIKWIGKLPDQADIFAGVEMVSHRMFNKTFYCYSAIDS